MQSTRSPFDRTEDQLVFGPIEWRSTSYSKTFFEYDVPRPKFNLVRGRKSKILFLISVTDPGIWIGIRIRNPGPESVRNPGQESGSGIRVRNPGQESGSGIRVGNPPGRSPGAPGDPRELPGTPGSFPGPPGGSPPRPGGALLRNR